MNKKDTISLKENTLKLNFGNFKSRKYDVSVKYFDNADIQPKKRIDYEAEIAITSNQGARLLDVFKQNIWFDQHEPDLINEMIANELSKTIYPIQAMIDEAGTFLEITNFNRIVNSRWHRNKYRATEKYNTEITRKFYNAFERNLENRNVFEKSLQYDWFWNLLFHPKYINYGDEHSVKTNLYLAVIPYEYPIQFTGKQKINTEITDYHSVEIHFKSDEMEAHNYFIPKNRPANLGDTFLMRLNVYFDLDVYYLFPMHTRANFEVFSKDSEGKEIMLKRIEFSQYQEDTESNRTSPPEKRSSFLVYDEDDDEDKEIYKTYEGKNYTYKQWKIFEEEQYKIYKEKKNKKGFWDFLG
jgi:hypothetical protein